MFRRLTLALILWGIAGGQSGFSFTPLDTFVQDQEAPSFEPFASGIGNADRGLSIQNSATLQIENSLLSVNGPFGDSSALLTYNFMSPVDISGFSFLLLTNTMTSGNWLVDLDLFDNLFSMGSMPLNAQDDFLYVEFAPFDSLVNLSSIMTLGLRFRTTDLTGSFSVSATSVQLGTGVVPEPSISGLLLLAAAGFAFRRKIHS